jgi:hypothetical protein
LLPAARTVTSSDDIEDSDGTIFADATSSSIVLTLPSAVGRLAKMFVIKCTNTTGEFVSLASAGGDIEGASTYDLLHGACAQVVSDGADWWVVATTSI